MVLLQGQRVLRLPLPPPIASGQVPADAPVLTNALGDLFLDYSEWLARTEFLNRRIFTCEADGRSGFDYFAAARLEQEEREFVHSRFPSSLKGRILRSVHFRVHPKFNELIELLYARYVDRFFELEKCFVELQGQRIACVMPGKALTELAHSRAAAAGHKVDALLPPNPWGNATVLGAVAHVIGCDLDIPASEARTLDNPQEYRYVCRLTDVTGRLAGNTVEVGEHQLSRDRQKFSKTLLKRFLRSCCFRSGTPSDPWQIQSRLAHMYGLPRTITPELHARNEALRLSNAALRRKNVISLTGSSSLPVVSPERVQPCRNHRPVKREATSAEEPREVKRPIRYPIEDLDLDPNSIFDARSFRKGHVDFPALPVKPQLGTDFGIEPEDIEQVLSIWSFFNNFGECLVLSNFVLDDFVSALKHDAREPCNLIAEMHAVMINILISEGIRCPGSASVSTALPLPPLAAEAAKGFHDGMTHDERARYIRRALIHARKWDRSQRLKRSKGRKGWERYTLGALCQRGALEVMPALPRILKHLFCEDDQVANEAEDVEEDSEEQEERGEDEQDDEVSDDVGSTDSGDEGSPAEMYPSLPFSDKLAILAFLCDLCLSCKKIRQYLDTSEACLTDLRKHRVDINRTKRELDARKLALDKAEGLAIPKKKGRPMLSQIDTTNGEHGPSTHLGAPGGDDMSVSGDLKADHLDSEQAEEPANSGDEKEDTPAVESKTVSGKGPKKGQGKGKGSPSKAPRPPDTRAGLESDTAANTEAEEENEREFRSCREVQRTQPLGFDRFFNAYYWLDGIGSSPLTTANGSVLYGTGRVFVRGPDAVQWATAASSRGGTRALKERQRREEGGPDVKCLEADQWAQMVSEEQLDQLIAWLNSKGCREAKLKDALLKWHPYIASGMTKRARDLRDPFVKPPPAVGDRRSARIAQEAPAEPVSIAPSAPRPRYLAWVNKLAAW